MCSSLCTAIVISALTLGLAEGKKAANGDPKDVIMELTLYQVETGAWVSLLLGTIVVNVGIAARRVSLVVIGYLLKLIYLALIITVLATCGKNDNCAWVLGSVIPSIAVPCGM